jgi:hypothetical protein
MTCIETILAVKTTCNKTSKKQCLEYHQQNYDVQQATYMLKRDECRLAEGKPIASTLNVVSKHLILTAVH